VKVPPESTRIRQAIYPYRLWVIRCDNYGDSRRRNQLQVSRWPTPFFARGYEARYLGVEVDDAAQYFGAGRAIVGRILNWLA
jgi:hypothetical protein